MLHAIRLRKLSWDSKETVRTSSWGSGVGTIPHGKRERAETEAGDPKQREKVISAGEETICLSFTASSAPGDSAWYTVGTASVRICSMNDEHS